QKFIIDDFGWGLDGRPFPEFDAIHVVRVAGWNHANAKAEANSGFTWTGISSGNPIDWAMKRFNLMGFNITQRSAIIYDHEAEYFTGTTLEGIGQSVVGVLQHPEETINRFVKVMSIKTCKNELLEACQSATGKQWNVQPSPTKTLLDSRRRKHEEGDRGWVLEFAVSQLFDEGSRALICWAWLQRRRKRLWQSSCKNNSGRI
ncbi:uncharacterized protein BCR38DRAFT_350856, partial [Pseudomassariella vexata]